MVLQLQHIHFTSIAIHFQGLAALCEKEDNPQLNAELPEVYTKLLHMYERYSVRTYLVLCMKLQSGYMFAFLFPYILCGRRRGSKSVSLELFGFSFLDCFIPLIEVEPFTTATYVSQIQIGFKQLNSYM